jgi:hypothetical protein
LGLFQVPEVVKISTFASKDALPPPPPKKPMAYASFATQRELVVVLMSETKPCGIVVSQA